MNGSDQFFDSHVNHRKEEDLSHRDAHTSSIERVGASRIEYEGIDLERPCTANDGSEVLVVSDTM